MAKDKFFKDIEAFAKKAGSFIELATSLDALDEYGELVKGKIQKRTRAGRGVAYPNQLGGSAVKLQGLSEPYKRSRRQYNKPTGTAAKPNKSNLTFTGQMLASLKATSKKNPNGRSVISVSPTGKRNKDLARWHAEGKGNLPNRVFLGLTRKDITEINREFAKTFSAIVRDVFK